MTTVAQRPTSARHLPPFVRNEAVDLATLTDWELQVVFYVIIPPGPAPLPRDLFDLIAQASLAADRLGYDAIRDIATACEYAWYNDDQAIETRFMPDRHRYESTRTLLNIYRRFSTARRPVNLTRVAHLADDWAHVINGKPATKAVAG
jgi:hypothetical protein